VATTEEVNILLKTVADTSGAQQVAQSLQQVQQQAQGLQDPARIATGIANANAALSKAMAGSGGTMADFQRNFKAVQELLGAAPTLKPEAFGIQPEQAAQATQAAEQTRRSLATVTQGVTEHAEAQQQLRSSVNLTATEFVRFATAGLGLGSGLSIASTAGHLLETALVGVVNQAIAADQSTRNLVATFGAAAANYAQFAQTLSRTGGGFDDTQIQGAIESVRPLAEQFHLTTVQVEGLVNAARELATIRDIPLSTALDALLGSLQGNATAAERLGLSMTDQQVAARAAGGAYRQTFDILSDGEKVTLRYAEALRQVDVQQKNVAASGPSVTTRAHELELQVNTLNTVLGQGPLAGFTELLTRLGGQLGTTTEKQKSLTQATQDWTTQLANTPGAGGGVVPSPQTFGPAPLTGAEISGPQIIATANQALQQVRGAISGLASTTNAQLAALAQREAEVMALNAEVARQAIESGSAVTNALQVALERATDPAEVARLQARLDLINRLGAANESLLEAQRGQNQLQQQGIQLTAQQAAIQLRFLPAQQQQLATERELNRVKLEGQRAALGPNEALQDLQYEEQRARLIARNRFAPVEDRIAARRDLRQLVRAEPGVELTALEANRAQTPIDRALDRLRIESGLQQNVMQTALAPIQGLLQQNQLLSQIAAGIVGAREQTVNVILSGAVDVSSNGQGASLSDTQVQQVVAAANSQFIDQFTAGINEAERSRSQRLLGAR